MIPVTISHRKFLFSMIFWAQSSCWGFPCAGEVWCCSFSIPIPSEMFTEQEPGKFLGAEAENSTKLDEMLAGKSPRCSGTKPWLFCRIFLIGTSPPSCLLCPGGCSELRFCFSGIPVHGMDEIIPEELCLPPHVFY